MAPSATPDRRNRFARFAAAGMFFQGGAATVDTGTFVAALVHGLTGSPLAVGTAAAIARYGWLFPQLIVAHLARSRTRRMPYYMFGAFGRAGLLAGLALVLWFGDARAGTFLIVAFFVLWTLYAFVGGVVAVPYNDIVARAIPSARRSRLLAWRFFGGGVLALIVAAFAYRILDRLPFPAAYGVIFLLGAALLLVSALWFVSAGEPPAPVEEGRRGFAAFLRGGVDVVRGDRRFRLFLIAQWVGGLAAMAVPFYILQASEAAILASDIAVLLGAQTVGALLSNPLWGWWGDHRGKLGLLRLTAACGALAPALTLAWLAADGLGRGPALLWFGAVFLVLGAVGNGSVIAMLGYLMEISPDHRRPAYSGYFNALVAPVALFPIAAAALAELASFAAVFTVALGGAALQLLAVNRLRAATPGDTDR